MQYLFVFIAVVVGWLLCALMTMGKRGDEALEAWLKKEKEDIEKEAGGE
jgi:hypothetical protein